MLEIYKTTTEYNIYTDGNKKLRSDVIYYVEDSGAVHFYTNNVDGKAKVYNAYTEGGGGGIIPYGNIVLSENGTGFDVSTYATASVNVPVPSGYILPKGVYVVTDNSPEIDVSAYAYVSVDVPVPQGYIIPTGNIDLTENTQEIDVSTYATATVNVEGGQGGFQPSGNINITENGDNIDVYDYATATVNVPIPEEYIKPQGLLMVNSNTSQIIDIKQFAYLSVDVPQDNSILESLIDRSIEEIYIPDTITEIGAYAFAYCRDLSYVYIPDCITTIGAYAFYGCESLDNVHIPASVEEIGSYAFYGSGIGTVFVDPDIPPTIGDDIFDDNTIDEIVVPNEAKQDYIDDPDWGRWFNNIIDEDEYEEEHPAPRGEVWLKATVHTDNDGEARVLGWSDNLLYDGRKYWSYIKINGSEPISTYYGTTEQEHSMHKNTLPYLASGLEPNSYVEVEYKSSYWSDDNASGDIIITVGNDSGIGGLRGTSICYFNEIPSYFTKISTYGLTGCTTYMNKDLTLEGITYIRDRAFYSNAIKTVYLPDIVEIGEEAFYNGIGYDIYYPKTGYIILGENCERIRPRAFYEPGTGSCYIYSYAVTPPSLNAYTFRVKSRVKGIYVPSEAVEDYKQAPNWDAFASYIQAM